MKRNLAAVLAALSVFAAVPASAATKTDKRNAFEFCYLLQSRLSDKYKISENETTYMTDYRNGIEYYDKQLNGQQYYANLLVGTAVVSVPDSNIDRLEVQVYDFNASEDECLKTTARAVAALSALEFDATQSSIKNIMNTSSTRDASLDILETIAGKASSAVSNEGEEIFAYSGNYDYYLLYWSNAEHDLYIYDFIAKARQ